MRKVRLYKYPVGARLIAALLFASFLFLTAGPVCGSTSDLDPDACCQRHRCQRSAAGITTSSGVSRGPGTCAQCDNESCSGRNSAQDCCRLGYLSYPVAQVQSAYQATTPVLTLYRVVIHTGLSLVGAGCVRTQFEDASPPLKLGSAALYILNSTFRI